MVSWIKSLIFVNLITKLNLGKIIYVYQKYHFSNEDS